MSSPEEVLSAWAGEFKSPGNLYRGAPFWSWNERLTPEECVRQARDMLASGMGGGFMHSREGLETPYLGEEWMECIRAVVDDSKESGFLAWLYDEDRWPSGPAGGLVTIPHPEHAMKGLTYKLIESTEYHGEEVVRALGAEMKGKKVARLGGVSECSHALVFEMHAAKGTPWHNGGAYLDTLDASAVRAFIDSTYEVYKEAVGDEFTKAVPGIFTDEPNYGSFRGQFTGPSVPWTGCLPEVFEGRYGYSILDRLPCLFFAEVEGENALDVRRDYWDCVTHLFVTNFSKQIGDWCGENGIVLSGHYLAEGSLQSQTAVIGAAMRHYEHQQWPGIDILCESIEEDLTVKQCSSAARQFGRERVLSELYGCTGWDFTFEGQKWVGDWQFAGGVNYRCQHLTLYGLRGLRKRDYPPSFNYQSTFWPYNKHMEDYFARLSYMLTRGKPVRDVLLVHPIESAWAVYLPDDSTATGEIDDDLKGVMNALFDANIDFDLGDEDLMSRVAAVKDGALHVGEAEYSVVVVPPTVTLRRSTYTLLRELIDAGGHVVVVSPHAKLLDCRRWPAVDGLDADIFRSTYNDHDEIAITVAEAVGPKNVKLESAGGEAAAVRYQLRREDGEQILFVCNTDRESGVEVSVTVPGEGEVAEWDLVTGGRHAVESAQSDDDVSFRCDLGPTGSALFVIAQGACEGLSPRAELETIGKVELGPEWSYELDEPNALTLDRCSWSVDGGDMSDPEPVWRASRGIRKAIGLGEVSTGGVQRWKAFPEPKDTGRKVRLEFGFDVKEVPAGDVWLAIERPGLFEIELNGASVANKPDGWFVDRSFEKILLPRLAEGGNTVSLSCSYGEEFELEDCYLVGDFGVNAATQRLTSLPETLSTGSWVEQGLPFYSGCVTYKTTAKAGDLGGKKVFLSVGTCAATLIEVFVGGESAGVSMWPPFEVDVTDLVTEGENEIGIKVISSRKNLLGPLHHTSEKLRWTGAAQFLTNGSEWTDEYRFRPYGILGEARLELRG